MSNRSSGLHFSVSPAMEEKNWSYPFEPASKLDYTLPKGVVLLPIKQKQTL